MQVSKLLLLSCLLSICMKSVNAQCTKTSCFSSTNTGLYSSAIGNKTNSLANYAFASGDLSTASGESSTAFGISAAAMGRCSFSLGNTSSATGENSIALGYYASTTNDHSFAVGYQAVADGLQSFAIGQNSYAKSQAYAFGYGAKANCNQTIAIGKFVETRSSGTIVIGSSVNGYSLINDIPNSLMIGFNSTVPTFFVGPSTNLNSIGKVGIGTTNPQSTLHIVGDATISTLANTSGDMLLTTDATGKLMKISKNFAGDNLGSHIATQNLQLGEYSILNGGIGDGATRPDGSRYTLGLRFSRTNSMVLETGNLASLSVVSGSEMASAVWVSNWTSGGYGLVLNPDNRTGGIYYDANNPTPVVEFNKTKVGIGILPPLDGKYNLYVTGGILTEELQVQLKPGADWPDYVFAPEYKLRKLKDVECFISKNQHLPDLPSSENIKNDGINVGEMNALLLKKIEELTLYVIELEKKYETLEGRISMEPNK